MKLKMFNTQVLTLTRVLDVMGGRRGRGWPVVPPGFCVLLLLMEFGFAERGRDGTADLDGGYFPVLLTGWRFGRGGVAGAMSKCRKALASLSVK